MLNTWRRLAPTCLVFALLAAACGAPTPTTEDPIAGGSGESGTAIAWFEGMVEEAFAFAKENQRPVFLYWGAVWCPPCHYLKDKIFARQEFVAKSRQFVPVYLDGDTERAQVWGEKLDTRGYPTVIILDPDGTEVLRMSTDVPVQEYAQVLDMALEATRPVAVTLDEVLEVGPAEADPDDLGLLAYHSWEQDGAIDLATPEMAAKARRLWVETPEDRARERSRFLSLYLTLTALDAQEEHELDETERGLLLAGIEAVIADAQLRRVNWYLFGYGLEPVAELLTEPGPQRDRAGRHMARSRGRS